MNPKKLIIICILLSVVGAANADTLRFPIPEPENAFVIDIPKAPPLYDPTGKVDPFQSCIKEYAPAAPKKEIVMVPDTPLTQWVLQQLVLKGTVIREKGALAVFETPEIGPTYSAKVGDFVGRLGVVIVMIQNGQIRLSNGNHMKTKE